MHVPNHAHLTRKVTAFVGRHRNVALAAGVAATVVVSGAAGATAASMVGSAQIRNQSIRSVDIHASGVGRSELRHNSVNWYKIQPGTVGPMRLRPDVWQQIQSGGAPGKDGVSGYEVIGRGTDAQDVTDGGTVSTLCASTDSGAAQQSEVAVSGGAKTTGTATVVASYPSAISQVSESDSADPAGRFKAGGWTVRVTGTGHVAPYVVCANIN